MSRPSSQLLLSLVLCFIPLRTLLAQSVTFETVNLPRGFIPPTIPDIRQDQQGYLWVATGLGLLRYNGYEWTTYLHDPKNTNSLAGNKVGKVCPTRNGLIWVGTWGTGLDCLDPQTGQVTHHPLTDRKQYDYNQNHISALLEDHQGTLWVGTLDGLFRRDAKTGRFVHYASRAGDPTSLSHPQVQVLYEDRQGTLWVGTGEPSNTTPPEGGLNRLDPHTSRFTRYLHDPADAHSLADSRIQAILEDSRGTFWVGTAGDGLHTMDRKTGRFTHYAYQPDHPEKLSRPYLRKKSWLSASVYGISFIEEDPAGAVWIGADANGVNRYEPATGQLTHFETGLAGGLPDNNLHSAGRTRDGVLWMAVQGRLVKVVPTVGAIARVATPAGVHAFHEDTTGTLWLSTVGGLRATEPLSPAGRAWLGQAARQTRLLTDHVTRLSQDRSGDWWMSTWDDGLYRYEHSSGQFTHFRHDSLQSASLSPGEVILAYQDRSGTHWVLTGGGLDRLDAPSGRFTHFRHNPQDSASISISSSTCLSVLEDRTGAFWVGGLGLNLLDRRTGKSAHFLEGSLVIQLLEDKAGTLWVATDSGLYRLDRQGNRCLPFLDPRSGQPLSFASVVQEDRAGNLWVGTLTGLVAINAGRDSLRRFAVNYGIDGEQDFYYGSNYQSRDGTLFFGGNKGYFRFRPEQLLKSPLVPAQLVLSALRIHNQAVKADADGPLREGLFEGKTIRLSHQQGAFSLDFVGIDYRHPQQQQYTYRLENYDGAWRPLGSERTANYYNVPPGAYVFRVRVANSGEEWAEKTITILISPPWWRTPWAYAGYVFAFAGLFYGGWRSLLGRERAQNERKLLDLKAEQLLEIERLKSRFFANISHELRTPLTLILSPLEKKLRTLAPDHPEQGDVRLMQRNAQRLLHLVNQLLDLSKLEAGKMKLETRQGDLVPFFRRIADGFTSLAETRAIRFTVDSPAESVWVSFDADKLEKILNNLLSNAFKFTLNRGEVSVSLTFNPNRSQEKSFIQAEFTVRDTGMGIPPQQLGQIFDRFHQVDNSLTREQEGTGIGLSLTHELVELHQGTISVTSELGKGSKFTVSLPLERVQVTQAEETGTFPEETNQAFGGATAQLSQPLPEHQPSRPEPDPSAPLVLVVEDNADLRQFIGQSLTEHAAFSVLEATDGEEGLQLALEHIPDLVISDVMMPKMDGIQLCQRLKTDEKTSHVPVILLTAKASGDSKVEGLETGADDYLTKPFQVRELLVRIQNLIEGRRKLREHYSQQVLLQPKDIAITSADERFLLRAMEIIEQNLAEVDFGVEVLGRGIGMSRMQMYRKLQALTGQSPSDFIKAMRLQRAAQLLIKGSGTVSEIAYQVGFGSHSYFSKCFAEQYGKTPSEYVAEQAKTL